MKHMLSTVLVVALLLSLGALAVLARGGGDILTPVDTVVSVAAQPQTAAAPDAQTEVPAPSSAPAAPQSSTGFNWIAIPLNVFPAGSMASDLAAHLAANMSGTATVETISQWNPVAQGYDIYYPAFGFDDFLISNQAAYRVEVSGSGNLTWSMVGDVPGIGSHTNDLYQTATTSYNWIMYPLDRPSTSMASNFAADIEANASGGTVSVQTITQWNATAQGYDIYYHQLMMDDFMVTPGYPYRVEVQITGANKVTWR